ncbi:hypothetical protein [Microbacterium timonense]|uniref:hypothetical protein n=1 Tax=Microbacterium timonense TaxID=2086576 RepID=UPI000D109E4C|nr:hypothetical protein [Microbacterium timonense]
MTADAAGAAPAAAGGDPADVGLWRERWFRVLTIVNVCIVVVSGCLGLATLLWPSPTGLISWLLIAFPVVPATVAVPAVSGVIIASAAALSSISMLGQPQKGVRFVRAMTVWGTIVLSIPVAFTTLCGLTTLIAGLW